MSVRFAVHVRAGARRTTVGGRWGDGERAALVVRVQAPAVGGRANAAVLAALAVAFDVRPAAVRLVRGATSRTKLVEIDGVDEAALERLLAAEGDT